MSSLASYAYRAAFAALALSLSMCTGTETDNPLVGFDATTCKHGEALSLEPAVAQTRAALDRMEPEEYTGLFCYAWQLHDGSSTIDVINYKSGCTIDWSPGDTKIDYEHVELGIQNASCAVAACGSCSYDLTFELKDLTRGVAADVAVVESDCEGQKYGGQPGVELPIDREPEGIVCRYAIDSFPPACGVARQPPCAADDAYEFGTCDDGCGDGLTCVEAAFEDHDMCFTACTEDADCPLSIESCQSGACRLRETF